MKNKEAIEHLKNINSRYPCSLDSTFREECEQIALNMAIKALENSSHIIDALEKLKDETMDAIVKFGIEKSIECIKEIEEENA